MDNIKAWYAGLSKREVNILSILAVVLLFAILLFSVILPIRDKKEQLQADITSLDTNIAITQENINTADIALEGAEPEEVVEGETEVEPGYENMYDLEEYSGKFFSNVDEDEMIMLLDSFIPVEAQLNDSLFMGNSEFNTSSEVITVNYDINRLKDEKFSYVNRNRVSVEFAGTFTVLEQFVKNIKDYEYPIYINGLNLSPYDPMNPTPTVDLTSEDPYSEVVVEYLDNSFRYHTKNEEYIKGSLQLEFIEFPVLSVYDDTNVDDNLFASGSGTTGSDNPFMPFDGFFKPTVIEPESEVGQYDENGNYIVDGEVVDPNDYTPDGYTPDGYIPEVVDPYTYKSLYGFESNRFFFVGKPQNDVDGSVLASTISNEGKYSISLDYTFSKGFKENIAYAVAEDGVVTISEKPAGLLLDVYSSGSIAHTVGIVVRDNAGVETEVDIMIGKPESGWVEVPIVLPDTVNYPCELQRIYVKDNGVKDQTSGTIGFDNLRLVLNNSTEE
ncbi:MAG: type II secretion system protein GspM [Lachnospirales bacterium]